MKVTIEYDNPDAAKLALDAFGMKAALGEIDGLCRNLLKHGMGKLSVEQALERIRELTRYED